MGEKQKPEVQKHMHKDVNVTAQRVHAFGKEKYGVRIQVLAALRLTAGDQSWSTKLAFFALALSLLALILRPADVDTTQSLPSLALVLANAVLGLIAAAMLAPVIIPASIHQGRQERARIWLAAYEDETQRRASR